jgi:hypothetical protein
LDSNLTSRRLTERGVTSIQFVLVGALSLLLFLALANLVIAQYGRGAIRSALDQGARVAAVTGSTDGCEQRATAVLGQLLGGAMGAGADITCVIAGSVVTARGTARFESWTPFSPDFPIDITAHATLEPVRE